MMTIDLRTVDEFILQLCSPHPEEHTALDAAIASHMHAGGGRLRAAICLDAAVRLGVDATDAIRLAAICELLHNASLIQDDMLDRSATRRGSPSVWCQYSPTVAVCAGDLMLSAAYAAVHDLSGHSDRGALASLIHQRVCDVIRGQVVEQQPIQYNEHAQDEYERRARGKSASLLSLALELPLLYTGHTHLLAATHQLVSNFATAYQIADDLLDQEADASEELLNIVLVIEKAANVPRDLARTQAAQRGLVLFAQAVHSAEQLPFNSAHLLIRHAKLLQAALEAECMIPAGKN